MKTWKEFGEWVSEEVIQLISNLNKNSSLVGSEILVEGLDGRKYIVHMRVKEFEEL